MNNQFKLRHFIVIASSGFNIRIFFGKSIDNKCYVFQSGGKQISIAFSPVMDVIYSLLMLQNKQTIRFSYLGDSLVETLEE